MSDRPTEPTGQEQCTLPADLVQRLIAEARKASALLSEAMNNVDFDVNHWRVDDDRQEGEVIYSIDVYFTLADVLDEVEAAMSSKAEQGGAGMNNVDFDVNHWRVDDDRQEGEVIYSIDVYFTLADVLDEVDAAMSSKAEQEGQA